MALNRRSLLTAASAGAALLGTTVSAAEAAPAVPAFKAPTAKNPLLLCFNENPLGMSAAARKAAAHATVQGSRYPFLRTEVLRKAIADYMGAKPANIMPSHGSAEAIRASIEAYNTPDVQVVVPELTYSDGADTARKNNMKVTTVAMGKNWSIDIPAMKSAVAAHKGHSIVYFVNPNNPTSTLADSKALLDWIRSKPAKTFFVIDEAYTEFVDDPKFVSATTLVKEGYENLVVLKTFSKIFAMAGMRLGFAFAHPKTINQIRRHVAYDVMMNICSIEAGLAEITDNAFIDFSRSENAKARKLLCKALDELGIEYLKSQTNFVFMNLKAPLKPFAERMKAEHILVGRPFPPAVEWCRVSLGTPAETAYFVKKLREFRQKGWV